MRFKELQFPLAGLDRAHAYQNQPPYSTMDAMNVRPWRHESKRMAGGSRPGIRKWSGDQLAGRVNLLASCVGSQYRFIPGEQDDSLPVASAEDVGVDGSFVVSFMDDFEGEEMKSHWEAIGTLPLPNVKATVPGGEYASPVGAARKALSYDTTKPRTARMAISAPFGASDNGIYSLILGMDNDASQGVCARISKSSDGMAIRVSVNGSEVHSSSLQSPNRSGVLSIRIEADGSATVGYDNAVVFTTSAAVLPGTRLAFMLEAEKEGDVAAIDAISLDYYENVADWPPEDGIPGKIVLDRYSPMLVAGSLGDLWVGREGSSQNTWTKVSTAVKTHHLGYVMAQQRLRDLFVADWGDYKGIGTDGTVSVSGDVATLTAASVSDWTALGIEEGSDVIVLSDVSDGMSAGSFIAKTVSSSGVVLEGYAGTGGNCAWNASVSPKVFSPGQGTYVPFMATEGMVPVGCSLICLYRDRLVLAGSHGEPHMWYMSRQGDPYDWNYVEDTSSDNLDYGIAVAGYNSDAGVVGKPIRALIPHSDDYLVFGYDHEMWILRGDPAAGGQVDCLSRSVGVVGKRAWCHGANGEAYFLSQDGVYVLAPGGESYPKAVSRTVLPVELAGVDWRDNVQMSYDVPANGIHIFIEGKPSWFFSLDTGSFWPVGFGNGAVVTATMEYRGEVLMGCFDGFVRTHDDAVVTDDGECFDSFVAIGPVRLGRGDYSEGVLQRMDATMCGSRDASGARIDVFTGSEAIDAAAMYGYDEPAGGYAVRGKVGVSLVRIRGGAVVLKVGQYGLAEWWGMERIGIYAKDAGRFRE